MVTIARNRMQSKIPLLVRALTVALLLGGLAGGLSNFNGVILWPWEMPILAHRFLASASAAYIVGSLLTLMRPRWLESELLIATVVLYGVPLGLAVALQSEKVNWNSLAAWGFVLLVIPSLIISLAYLWVNRKLAATEVGDPLNKAPRIYLLTLGTLALVVGLIVFVIPKSAGMVWPWATLKAWAELDSRVAASMLLTIGGSAFLVRWRNDRKLFELFLAMFSAYCVVATIALILHAFATPAFVMQDIIYIAIFAVLVVAGWQVNSKRA